jgi:hypothetical protein
VKRRGQYLLLAAAILVAGLGSYVGFVSTGGAVPWGQRFAAVMQGGASGGGSLVQFGRGGVGGFLLAGPLRDDVLPFVLLVLALVVGSVGLYWWSSRVDAT